jgi:hypothetical protein
MPINVKYQQMVCFEQKVGVRRGDLQLSLVLHNSKAFSVDSFVLELFSFMNWSYFTFLECSIFCKRVMSTSSSLG